MKTNQTMCQDQDLARLNRERVNQDIGGGWWESQARATAQWKLDEPKPESVVLGDLPYVGRVFKTERKQSLDDSVDRN